MKARRVLSLSVLFFALAALAAEVEAEMLRDLEFFRMLEVIEAQERGEVDESLVQGFANNDPEGATDVAN